MESVRLPRFKRTPDIAPIKLTARDGEIIRLVYQHRFLRSSHLVSLVGKSRQQLLRRLQLLYHHGYLERPRAQIEYYHRGGSRCIVYGLGRKATALLEREFGLPPRKLLWSEKNRAVGRMFLEHALLVSDVMVALELACRQTAGVRMLTDVELVHRKETSSKCDPFHWQVAVSSRLKLGIIPDRVFAFEFAGLPSERNRAYFFLEADRATMPVQRGNLSQSSFYRKLIAYEATWTQGLHRTLFGFNRFRVLTVTNSSARVGAIMEACAQLQRGRGLFLLASLEQFCEATNLLSLPLQTGQVGKTSALIE